MHRYSGPLTAEPKMKSLLMIFILLSGLTANAKSDVWLCPDDNGKKVYTNREFDPRKCRKATLPPISAVLPASRAKKRLPIALGMTRERVMSNWGKPNKIYRTLSANGVHEQWIYPKGNFLYFSNGILDIIQDQI
jgi:hypothetical protein